MTMQILNAKFTGVSPMLVSNPHTVSRSNPFNRAMAAINAKKTRRTDADYAELADLEVESRLYWDKTIGVYVPARWVLASITGRAFAVIKVGKERIRGAVFMPEDMMLPLTYRGKAGVKKIEDVVKNPAFRHSMILPQGQVRIEKTSPIFHEWSFGVTIEFDDTVLDSKDLQRVLQQSAQYVGFGDFRPTFGRARVAFTE